MKFLARNDLNSFNLNGKRISITWTANFIVLEIEVYNSPTPIRIPIYVSIDLWKSRWETEEYEYLDIQGYLITEEISPHVFEYRLEAEQIYPSDATTCTFIKPKNQFQCIAYIARAPKVLCDVHPYITTLFLGTGSFLEDGIFTGQRFQFDVTLLRKKTLQAEKLERGDIIKLKATLTNSKEHNIQLIGKEINLMQKNPIYQNISAENYYNTPPEPV